MLFDILRIFTIIGASLLLAVIVLVLCIAGAPKNRKEEDQEQINFLKNYFNRKDDNND